MIKYQTIARWFETKYSRTFVAFRYQVLNSEPSMEIEQDYFDWELAVTGIEEFYISCVLDQRMRRRCILAP